MCNFLYNVGPNPSTSAKQVKEVSTLRVSFGFQSSYTFFSPELERLVVAAEHCEKSLEDLLRERKPVR